MSRWYSEVIGLVVTSCPSAHLPGRCQGSLGECSLGSTHDRSPCFSKHCQLLRDLYRVHGLREEKGHLVGLRGHRQVRHIRAAAQV